jgi:RNA polymerase sigma factor (sigma-70 family)
LALYYLEALLKTYSLEMIMVSFETLVLRAQSSILPLEQRQDAFAELVDRFQNFIIRQAASKLNDTNLIPDTVQETFLSAWLHLDQLQHPRAFPTWLKSILHTQCNRITRRTQIESISIDNLELASHLGEQPDIQFEWKHLRNQVRQAIDQLPKHEHQVVDLYYIKGHTQREISTITHLPIKTIKSRLYSARQRLHNWLQPMLDENMETISPTPILPTAVRPDQATNMLTSALEITRLEAYISPIFQSDTQTRPYISIPQISGAIVSIPHY